MALHRLIDRCEISSANPAGATAISGKHRAIDVRKLETALLDLNREALSERRHKMNELYQEAKLEEDPGKGISFQTTLLLLGRYMLNDEREALTYVTSRIPFRQGVISLTREHVSTGPRNGLSDGEGKVRSLSCVSAGTRSQPVI